MKFLLQTGAIACLLVLAACEPKECAEWSPDGSRAAVLAEQRLHLAGPAGGLSKALADHDGDPGRFLVDAFDWLPDGSGLVLHRVRIVPAWEDFAPLLPPIDAARVGTLASRVPALLEAALALHGDADRADQLLGRLAPQEGLALGNAFRLALAKDAATVRAALAGAPLALASLDPGDKPDVGFLLHEIAVIHPDTGEPARILWRGLRGVHSLRVSPRHPAVACTVESGNKHRFDLLVLPLEPGPATVVAPGITRAFDWTPDGRSLVFMSSLSEGTGGLVEIERRLVLDPEGRTTENLPGGEGTDELAYAIVAFAPRLAVLPGGEILFASHPVALPAAAGDLKENPRLYRLPPDGGAPVPVSTGEGALPMDLGYFAPSPDGRRVAVVESGTDAVAVIDLETGRSELVSPPHPSWKSRVMPSWRNAEEFSFAAADLATGRVRWMLWKNGKSSDLSVNWPHDLTRRWMDSKPATP